MTELREVVIYTDGACVGNPGPGGYGALLRYEDAVKEMSGGFRNTTNNRMEIMAAIVVLKALKEPCKVTLYSDSRYLVDAVAKGWVERWRSNGWRRNKKERAINVDLWEQLLPLVQHHDIHFAWVRGHNGNRDNERVDFLAEAAARRADLPEDPGYQ